MPVNSNTCQPLGMLNGGASLALIETVGSMAANLALDRNQFVAVGQQVNANHFKPAYKGETVVGTATPIHIGRTSQVWEVLVEGLSGTVHCKGTITMAVLPLERLRG